MFVARCSDRIDNEFTNLETLSSDGTLEMYLIPNVPNPERNKELEESVPSVHSLWPKHVLVK